ncbi:Ger(x)C family spore germination protein [Pontibacillus sp. HMF3514]|uniref:Ger(x)C family spore germination protein n=1 Tax=Pontibacillus sp. HMF3514 TaxID=2692425 RepID=UPI00131FDA28|nr:Ger(x)C family spore germination protein [Pontibacillus sp. HMF3514]QHE51183.1 Ger(x)C family spore germination protein [Pontibacillus sp. HMF3514]
MRRFMLMILMVSVLSGCWDLKQLEHAIYVTGLGIDYKDDKMHIYIRSLPLENVGKSEGGSGKKQDAPVWIGHGVGDSFDSATDNIYFTSQQRISWSHIGHIVFTEDALKRDRVIDDVVDVLNRFAETRSAIWLYGTQSEVDELFNSKPILDLSPYYAKENNPNNVYKQFSIAKPKSLRQYLIERYEPGKMAEFPVLNTNQNQWSKREENHPIQEWGGLMIMDKARFKGAYSIKDIKGLRWIEKSTKRAPLYLYKDESVYASIVADSPKVNIKPVVKGSNVQFNIEVEVSGTIIENPQKAKVKELEQLSTEKIKKQIRNTYLKGLENQADIYDLGYRLYKKKPKEFKRLKLSQGDWLKEDTIKDIKVGVTLESGGKLKVDRMKKK